MNLSENLKRIRKENNLSQEQLADKLGVSRQSVSKWESGIAYPEMDKVLQICKMFNLNIDELLNQNLKEINEVKQRKNNANKVIDDILDYIRKTIDMFSSMKLKEQLKCLLEEFVIVCFLICIFLVFKMIISNVIRNFLIFLPENIYYILYNILTNGVYTLFCLVFGISIILYVFKIRYLDYYVIVKDKKEDVLMEEDEKESIGKKKFFSKPLREKIIIREPKHSGYKFISSLIKMFLMILKTIVIFISTLFCFSLIILFALFTLSFLFVKTGFLFIGVLFILISSISINIIILNILYTFIVDKKRNIKILSTSFLCSLMFIGMGIGFSLIGIKDFDYITSLDNSRYIVVEENLTMNDNSFIKWLDDEDYIESNNEDIKIVISHSSFMQYEINQFDNGHIEIWYSRANDLGFKEIRILIEDINDKRIVDYYNIDFKVYASKENIEKLKKNRDEYYNKELDYYRSNNYNE